MTDANEATPNAGLLAKISTLITAQAAGKPSGFTGDELNHVYLDLVQGRVSESSNELLVKMLGEEWSKDYESNEGEGYELGKDVAMAESVEDIDMNDLMNAIGILASALMVACRELGWAHSSRAAHAVWFRAGDED